MMVNQKRPNYDLVFRHVCVKLSPSFYEALKDVASIEGLSMAGKARQLVEDFLLERFPDRLDKKDKLGTKIGRPKGVKWKHRRQDGSPKTVHIGCYIRICNIDTVARLAELQHISESELAEKMVARFRKKGQFDFAKIRQRKRDGERRHNTGYAMIPQCANFLIQAADESGCSISGIVDYVLEWMTPYMLKKIEKLEKEETDEKD